MKYTKGYLHILLIFFLFNLINCSQASNFTHTQENWTKMVPLMEEKMVTMMMFNETKRRKLGTFQICAMCTCCGGSGAKRICLASPCCYAINCNIPNRPFGFCSFTPKTCNCFGCHL
ncbi:hypothetical protein ACFE04_003199 [Oxalis oulophora]